MCRLRWARLLMLILLLLLLPKCQSCQWQPQSEMRLKSTTLSSLRQLQEPLPHATQQAAF